MYDIWHSFFHHLFVALLNNLFRHPIGLGVKVQTINHIVSTIGGLCLREKIKISPAACTGTPTMTTLRCIYIEIVPNPD